MERREPCSLCRERFKGKTRTKNICSSCTKVLPPSDEQTNRPQGFHSLIKSFGSHMKSKLKPGTVTPSLNHDPPSDGSHQIRSSKRAVLCGITYSSKRRYRLKGTINDVRNMRDLLVTNFGYPKECIRVLTGMFLILGIHRINRFRFSFFNFLFNFTVFVSESTRVLIYLPLLAASVLLYGMT